MLWDLLLHQELELWKATDLADTVQWEQWEGEFSNLHS